jgi:hypothetical protein
MEHRIARHSSLSMGQVYFRNDTVAVKPAPQGAIRTTRVGAENASAKRVKCTPALARENQGEPVTGFYAESSTVRMASPSTHGSAHATTVELQ